MFWQRVNSDVVLNSSGIVVSLFVALLSFYSVRDSVLLLPVIFLTLIHFVLFIGFLSLGQDRRGTLKLLFWLEAGCILILYFLVPSSFIAILGLIWIVQAADLFGPRRSAYLLLASVFVLFLSQIYHIGVASPVDLAATTVSFGLFQVFALSAVLRTIRERQQREEAARLNRELIATRDLLSQTSAQSERLRISRDLHDILGHHMTALILNLEVARHKSEGETLQKVEQSLAIAKLLLSDLRSTVSDLREQDTIDLEQSIRKLAESIPALRFEFDFSSAPLIKDVALAETLLRCVQEGITNILRHSAANRCEITLAGDVSHCRLTITDNGAQASAAGRRHDSINPGNGLNGMLERIRNSGGELQWQMLPEGFRLQADLSLERGA